MLFCLLTLTKSLGLGQDALAARTILNDRKAIDLCLLKKACWLDLKHNPDHKTLYRTYRSWFKRQVVPVSYNPSAIKLIENDLGGLIVQLNQKSMDAVDHMNNNYHPYFEDLTNVFNCGGDNIWYRPPAKSLPEWNSFDKKPQLQPFIHQVSDAIKFCWSNKSSIMEYDTVFIFLS